MNIRYLSVLVLLTFGTLSRAAPVLPPVLPPPVPPVAAPVPVLPDAPQLPRLGKGGFKLNFDKIAIGELLAVTYYDVLKRPYVLDASLVGRNDYVSVSFGSRRPADVMPILEYLLKGLGFRIVTKNGIDFIGPRGVEKDDYEYFVYKTQNRSASYLVSNASSMFTGQFLGHSVAAPAAVIVPSGTPSPGAPVSPATPAPTAEDTVIFYGPPAEVRKFSAFAKAIDTPEQELLVTTSIYEVSDLQENETGFGAVLSLFNKSPLKVNLGQTSPTGNYISLGGTGISLIASILSDDKRFKVAYSASKRTRNGSSPEIVSGEQQQVTTGAVLDKNGNPIRTTEMRQSGLQLSLTPRARGQVVDLDIKLSISEFAGTGDSPKITNRSDTSYTAVEFGETVMTGSVRIKKHALSKSLLPFTSFSLGSSRSESNVEFLVFTTVERVPRSTI
jgi:type II secretory pathway component GspD/PulD (secretin)